MVAFTLSLVVALNTNIQGFAVGLLVGVVLEACTVVPSTIFGRYSRTCVCTLRGYTHHKCTPGHANARVEGVVTFTAAVKSLFANTLLGWR